jgi:type IV secretion system protein VirD4
MSGTPVRKPKSRRFPPRKPPLPKRKRRVKPPVIRVPPVSPVLKKYIIPYLPYTLFFWFGNKLGQAYRLAPGNDILKKLAGSMGTLNAVISGPPSIAAFDLFVGLASAVIIYALVYFKKKKARKYRKDTEYGSARWGSSADIKPFIDLKPENNVILTATESITMNSRPASPKYARNKNIMVIGGSGSGKTRFFVTPNIMQCQSKKYPVSFVVTDPKGGIMDNVGTMLVDNGYEIKVLNTVNFARSMRYNPFAYIRGEKDILKLVNTLIANTTPSDQKSNDPFWVKSETLLYCALIGFIHFEGVEKERNLNTLVEMINAMETKEDNEDFKNPIDILFDGLEKKQPQHFAVRQYRKFKLAAGKTSKSILISCGARLAPFDIKEVRDLMAADDLELDTLGDRKTALFVIISDTDDSFNFIVAMMYSQMFNLLCDKAVRP